MRRRARRSPPPVLAFSGASGAGKTRLLVRLVPALVARGLRLAAVKHSSHHHALDRRGSDTQRLRAAGAEAVAIQTADELAIFGPAPASVEDVVALLPDVDLVLVEGWKSSPLPKVEVHRRRVSREFLCAEDARVVAVVSDEPPPRDLPLFRAGEVELIADFVEAWLAGARRRRGGRGGAGAVSARKRSRRASRRRPAAASR